MEQIFFFSDCCLEQKPHHNNALWAGFVSTRESASPSLFSHYLPQADQLLPVHHQPWDSFQLLSPVVRWDTQIGQKRWFATHWPPVKLLPSVTAFISFIDRLCPFLCSVSPQGPGWHPAHASGLSINFIYGFFPLVFTHSGYLDCQEGIFCFDLERILFFFSCQLHPALCRCPTMAAVISSQTASGLSEESKQDGDLLVFLDYCLSSFVSGAWIGNDSNILFS